MSAEIRKERAIDWLKVSAVGDKRFKSEGMIDDSAPVEETEPTSSWLKRAIALTFPSRSGNVALWTLCAIASTAQNLVEWLVRLCRNKKDLRGNEVIHSRWKDELVVKSAQHGWLGVVEVTAYMLEHRMIEYDDKHTAQNRESPLLSQTALQPGGLKVLDGDHPVRSTPYWSPRGT